MGLAAPKNKFKLSHDPNNTKWTKDTTSFGHKIMTSQGWAPGQFLGAADAAHAEHYTAANASHIRVMLKDDNLGLGAKRGSGLGEGECTGLDVFQSLLGRLNAKDDDELAAIQKEQQSREDLKRAIYTEQRWGSIRFVRGGLLVGDKIEKLIEDEAERVRELNLSKADDSSDDSDSSEEEEAAAVSLKKSKKDKKSKKQEDSTEENKLSDRKSHSKKKRKAEDVAGEATESANSEQTTKRRKKSAKESEAQSSGEDVATQKALDKAARKLARKEEKRRLAAGETEGEDASSKEKHEKKDKKDKKDKKRKEKGVTSIDLPTPSISTPASSTPSSQPGTPNSMMSGRHAVRSRNIMQKRMASMDPAALAQIFMIKS